MPVLSVSGLHLIDGNFEPGDGPSRANVDPASGEVLPGEFRDATISQVDRALQSADLAFTTLQHQHDEWQVPFLERLAAAIEEHSESLIDRAAKESALPNARLQGELARTTGQLRLMASVVREGSWVDAVIDTSQPDRKPAPRPDLRRMQVPIGPVVVFDAVNFPFAFGACGNDTAAAFAAGCPVVVKSHPSHAGTDELFARITAMVVSELGLPTGVFNLLHGQSNDLSRVLVEHPVTSAVGFTGSFTGGTAIAAIAAARPHPVPVFAEMGSINPLFILPSALKTRPQQVAKDLYASVTLGVGQFCTKPGVVFLIRGDGYGDFMATLSEEFRSAPGGIMLNVNLKDRFLAAGASHFQLCGKSLPPQTNSEGVASVLPWLLPVDSSQWRDHSELRQESFGPGTIVVSCNTPNDLLECALLLDGQLTATIHCDGESDGTLFAQLLPVLTRIAGRLIYNGFPTGVEVCHAMVHGGPYPATTSANSTSVGSRGILRFTRPLCLQNLPDSLLPPQLKHANPLNLLRQVNGAYTREKA